ncbi:hypothetical protein [Brevibacterium sp.]|uniref:hypothetical protein n=1 Tax=Brevibacterium sp. TaxID=1701 RepID=UPI002810AFA9|nr:hypothetical protein [Brevibacterium sp.]
MSTNPGPARDGSDDPAFGNDLGYGRDRGDHLGAHGVDRNRDGAHDPDRGTDREAARDPRDHLVEREKEAFGGVKIGSAFFGWLTAVGSAVLLTALAGAVGALIGGATGTDAVGQAMRDPQSAGIIGAIVVAVILFIAYYCGGYVAGRMARFNGAKQGVAVWLWAVVIAVVVAVIGLITGSRFDVMSQLSSFPQVPDLSKLTTGSIIAALVALVVTLVGAILGGLAGMRFHRKVDRASLIDNR